MKHKIRFLQFYITNVCNLACPSCLTFSNFAMKGHYRWKDYEENSKKWSEILDPEEIAILGGEPFTNPDLDNWIFGLKKYFNPSDFRISTNGTFLEKNSDRILSYIDNNINLEISAHSIEQFNKLNIFLKKYYPIKISDESQSIHSRVCTYTDTNQKSKAILIKANTFINNAVKKIDQGVFYLHNNNPEEAHKNCLIHDSSHSIAEGRLYQCALTGAGTMFSKQFKLDDESKKILSRTKSISPFDDKDTIKTFMENILKPCEQCRLCPTEIETFDFLLPNKKPKIN